MGPGRALGGAPGEFVGAVASAAPDNTEPAGVNVHVDRPEPGPGLGLDSDQPTGNERPTGDEIVLQDELDASARAIPGFRMPLPERDLDGGRMPGAGARRAPPPVGADEGIAVSAFGGVGQRLGGRDPEQQQGQWRSLPSLLLRWKGYSFASVSGERCHIGV